MVLVQGRDGATIKSESFQAAVTELEKGLEITPHVKDVRSPLHRESPVSEDGKSALVQYAISGSLDEAEDRVAATQKAVEEVQAAHPELRIQQYGAASATVALSEMIEQDLHKAEALSMPITMIILIIAFGTLVAAGLPLILAFSAVIATMSLVALPSQIFPVNDNVASIILLVGLAVGVDYALFYLRREREERRNGHDAETSLQIAAATSGHAVLISGLTVIAAMCGMYLTGGATFTSLASGAVLVVAVAMVASISVLPALMSWLGDRVDRGRLPRLPRRKGRTPGPGFWAVVVERVMRRPKTAAALSVAFLVALTIPVIGMNTQLTAVTDLPRSVDEMKAYDNIQTAFPGQADKARVVVESDGNLREGAAKTQTAELQKRIDADDALFQDGTRTTYSKDGRTALIDIPVMGKGSDEKATQAVEQLRGEMIPATLGQIDGVEVNVSGDAAKALDEDELLARSLPIVFAFVLALTFVLMLATFRSIVIPIGTIVLNMLSVGAAYGVLVLCFQHGWGESLLGFESNGGITSWLPMFLFVILFGLSMDYHVFILSRVREAYDKGMSTDAAIKEGISATAGVVTSAAMVMVAVFATFATLSLIDMKEMGFGLAVAVLIDATIIRGVLLPASMKLLGDRTWYMPRMLERSGRPRRHTPAPQPEPSPA